MYMYIVNIPLCACVCVYIYIYIYFVHSFSALHRTEVRSEDWRDPHQLRSQLHQC